MNGVHNYQRDGFATVNGNKGGEPNYEPNSLNGPVEDIKYAIKPTKVSGFVGRNKFASGDIDMEQPRAFWAKVFTEWQK